MATYQKNGVRKYQLQQRKNAMKNLNNFYDIIQNMNRLVNEIDNYTGLISEDNLNTVANTINLEKKLSLHEDHINMVTKKYLEIDDRT